MESGISANSGTEAPLMGMAQKYKIFVNCVPVHILESNATSVQLIGDNVNPVISFLDKKEILKTFSAIETNGNYQGVTVFGKNSKQIKKELFAGYKNIRAAGGVVVNNKKEILMIHRRGVWDLPKGKINAGEKKRMAALREVREETGVKKLSILKKLLKTYHTYKTSDSKILKVTHWYLMMSDASGKLVPQKSESIEQAEWVNRNAIEERLKNTFPSIRDAIQTAIPALHRD